eukprot:TRINITY_DN41696_c0_g1_i3.p1 TRINITY_DN41696_c0_g1~~TRINITY_DN41696_c0_g1_i3.p1  ORF type:complete len:512 (+),score=36.76 TRINITY_DN41696_c0_g1_i3:74-1609(+)
MNRLVAGILAVLLHHIRGDESCWNPPYTEKVCCNRLQGPSGNPQCWDGLHYTYERCCPGNNLKIEVNGFHEVFGCVPYSTWVCVGLAVFVFACLLLLPHKERGSCVTVGEAETPSIRGDPRDAHVDNAKFVACTMMVMVHIASYSCGDFRAPSSAVIKALWFHMPFFAMLSGMVTKPSSAPSKLLRSLAAPLVMFVFVLQPAMNAYIKLFFPDVRIDERLSFAWTYADIWGSICMIGRIDLAWYVRCLLLWRLAWPMLQELGRFRYTVVVLGVGISSAYSHVDGLQHLVVRVPLRTASMFPFFALGQRVDWERIAARVPDHAAVKFSGWTALLSFVGGYIAFEPHVDKYIMSFETYPSALTSFRELAAKNCSADVWFLWARYVVDMAYCGALAAFVFVFCVPRRRTWFTGCGRQTLYPYLLHCGLLVIPLGERLKPYIVPYSWNWQSGEEAVSAERILLAYALASAWAATALLITCSLSSWPCRCLFSWALQPDWLVGSPVQRTDAAKKLE